MTSTYHVTDGGAEITIEAETAEAAAREYVGAGAYTPEPEDGTTWIRVHAWTLDEDGEPLDEESHTIPVDPEEPGCWGTHHDWCAPVDVVGGIPESPGVHGHGGGVVATEVCSRCGMYRIEDTWATDPATGEQGLRSLRYEDADGASEAWVDRD